MTDQLKPGAVIKTQCKRGHERLSGKPCLVCKKISNDRSNANRKVRGNIKRSDNRLVVDGIPLDNQKHHPEYAVWRGIKVRCKNKSSKFYKNYGGRGIDYDPRWDDFRVFLNDMPPRPSKDHSIDRIDNDKGYFKENCRWATMKEQSNNRRLRSSCRMGHPYTEDNTRVARRKLGTIRRCIICLKARNKRREDYARDKRRGAR